VPGRIKTFLLPESPDGVPWRLLLTVAAALVLVVAAKTYRAEGDAPPRDPRMLSLGLFLAIPVMLCTAMVFSATDFVSDPRQYVSLGPLSVFVAFSLIVSTVTFVWRPAALLARTAAVLYAGAYTAMVLLYLALALTPTRIGNTERMRVMATAVSHWPSLAVVHELSPAREWVMRRLEADPQTILLTSQPLLFEWDPRMDRARLVVMSCSELVAQRATGPATVLALTFDLGEPNTLWSYHGNGFTGGAILASCFEWLPGLKLIKEFPDERLKVLESRIEAGRHIALTR
jgi:hypothetical protein